MSSATPSPRWPRSSAVPRRRAASSPPQPAAASAPRRLPPPSSPPGRHRQGLQAAWEAKDIDALIGLLDPDAITIADGGGLAVTFLDPIEGGAQIAHAWVDIADRASGNTRFLERTVNGQPGVVAQQYGVTVTVFAFDFGGDRIKHIWVVRNPEKLSPWRTVTRASLS